MGSKSVGLTTFVFKMSTRPSSPSEIEVIDTSDAITTPAPGMIPHVGSSIGAGVGVGVGVLGGVFGDGAFFSGSAYSGVKQFMQHRSGEFFFFGTTFLFRRHFRQKQIAANTNKRKARALKPAIRPILAFSFNRQEKSVNAPLASVLKEVHS